MLYKHCVFFFFNDTATTEIYTLSLHDALPIFVTGMSVIVTGVFMMSRVRTIFFPRNPYLFSDMTWGLMYVLHGLAGRSEEHTSELPPQSNILCRLLLEKHNKSHHMDLLLSYIL